MRMKTPLLPSSFVPFLKNAIRVFFFLTDLIGRSLYRDMKSDFRWLRNFKNKYGPFDLVKLRSDWSNPIHYAGITCPCAPPQCFKAGNPQSRSNMTRYGLEPEPDSLMPKDGLGGTCEGPGQPYLLMFVPNEEEKGMKPVCDGFCLLSRSLWKR